MSAKIKFRIRNLSLLSALLLGVLVGPMLTDRALASSIELAPWPESAFRYIIASNGVKFGAIDLVGWSANWGWMDPTSNTPGAAQNGVLDVTDPIVFDAATNQKINLREQVSQSSPTKIQFKYTLSSEGDVPLTMLADAFSFAPDASGSIDVTLADGKSLHYTLPNTRQDSPDQPVSSIVFHVANVGDITAAFDPPLLMHPEANNIRMKLASDMFKAGTSIEAMTLTFGGAVQFEASPADVADHSKLLAGPGWFAWNPANAPAPGEIGMLSWLDAPAGKYGPVIIDGDHLKLASGPPIKFWGTNLAYNNCDPPKTDADGIASRFAKYGINCVRLHKFLNPGWQGFGSMQISTEFDPDGLDRFDNFTNALKQHGVYFGWSPNYHYMIRPGDAPRLAHYDELHALGDDTYDVINGMPDVQNVMISEVVALLKHKNPYTGLPFAKDPALAFVETQNEDDIFFYGFSNIDKYPLYKQDMRVRFGAWLKKKYGTQDALSKAWGSALHDGETVSSAVDIQTNPWFFTDGPLANPDQGARQRLLDNAQFYFDEQNNFYERFKTAVRAAGYVGPIIGSPWWGPTMLPQYYNLKSNAIQGLVDWHKYYSGDNDAIFGSMLSDPGSGYLNSGLMQVAGHPFSQSEWIHVFPDIYKAEGPAIMAAYGLGLQGWSQSFEFQSAPSKGFADHSTSWDVDVPSQIGQFPSLTRMLYRGDIKTADPIAVKRVSDSDLANGKFDFSDTTQVSGDVKSFTGTVPQEALAAGRTLVQFTENTIPSTFPEMSKYEAGKVITSTTKQLTWDYSGKGYFTIDTPATIGVVGFAQDKSLTFPAAGASIELSSSYGVVVVTALSKSAKTIAGKALITVLGRECNSGFRYDDLDHHMIDAGQAPIMEEGVAAKFDFPHRQIEAVNILDQDGRLQPGKSVTLTSTHSFSVNTSKDQTIYYEIVFKD